MDAVAQSRRRGGLLRWSGEEADEQAPVRDSGEYCGKKK
jgi:hypothetical protein